MIEEKIYSEDEISVIKEEIKKEVNAAVKESFDGKEFNVNPKEELEDVFILSSKKLFFQKTSPSQR